MLCQACNLISSFDACCVQCKSTLLDVFQLCHINSASRPFSSFKAMTSHITKYQSDVARADAEVDSARTVVALARERQPSSLPTHIVPKKSQMCDRTVQVLTQHAQQLAAVEELIGTLETQIAGYELDVKQYEAAVATSSLYARDPCSKLRDVAKRNLPSLRNQLEGEKHTREYVRRACTVEVRRRLQMANDVMVRLEKNLEIALQAAAISQGKADVAMEAFSRQAAVITSTEVFQKWSQTFFAQ
jgi:hypothetical protein